MSERMQSVAAAATLQSSSHANRLGLLRLRVARMPCVNERLAYPPRVSAIFLILLMSSMLFFGLACFFYRL